MQFAITDEIINLKHSALNLFVGDYIGGGASRRVYECLHDQSLVVKVEHAGRTFCNQTEWLIWQDVKGWPIADWFAPCVTIDSYGNVMLQKRTEPFDCDRDFRAAVHRTRGGVLPAVFDDIHFANFGMLDGRVTCHDYGYHKFFENTAREMSIEAGYIKFDDAADSKPKPHDFTQGGQLALGL